MAVFSPRRHNRGSSIITIRVHQLCRRYPRCHCSSRSRSLSICAASTRRNNPITSGTSCVCGDEIGSKLIIDLERESRDSSSGIGLLRDGTFIRFVTPEAMPMTGESLLLVRSETISTSSSLVAICSMGHGGMLLTTYARVCIKEYILA